MLMNRNKQSMDLQDELQRSKRVLDEKHYETLRLNDENAKKADHCVGLNVQAQDLEKDIDMLKVNKAENWREISRLKEFNDVKVRESAEQADRLKAMDYDLSRSSLRIEDTQKLIDARSYDLRNKQLILEDIQKELARIRDMN